jgi:hypothetical protein
VNAHTPSRRIPFVTSSPCVSGRTAAVDERAGELRGARASSSFVAVA